MEFLNPYELSVMLEWFNNHSAILAYNIIPVYLKEEITSDSYFQKHPFKNEETFFLEQYSKYNTMPTIEILEFMYNHVVVVNALTGNNIRKNHVGDLIYNVVLSIAQKSYFPLSQELRTNYYRYIGTSTTKLPREMFEVFKRHRILNTQWYDNQKFNNDRLVLKDPSDLENAFIPYSKRIPDDITCEI